ncbi:MFS transporter [Pseudonocardia ailaonensis]|uniref:MFS transporter n=1 Tax=Pseudonocardia ailaonensis TaxID=367279 RepID=A0ABN2NNE9_9PSEU
MGRRFGWLWAAYAASAAGTGLAFGAFALVALLVLHAGPVVVSGLAAAGPLVGALVAVPLGSRIDRARKRPLMIAMDLARLVALLSVPAAYLLGLLTMGWLVAVAVLTAAADITFTAASGAYLRTLVPGPDLLRANGRLEATTWTTTMLGPPLGGLLAGIAGPLSTMVANAASFLLSAAGLTAIGSGEPRPEPRPGRADLLGGWRTILARPGLRRLFANTLAVNALIMATEPLLAVLLLGPLGFAPWQYGLAFAAPCLGGLLGSRLARHLVGRFGEGRTLRVAGILRACWSLGPAFVGPGAGGLALLIGVEFGLILCASVFNPVLATHRLRALPQRRIGSALAAWSITGKVTTAVVTAAWGVLGAAIGPRAAVATAGVLLLLTPLLLAGRQGREPARPEG